ncbi:hypothetical protein EZS27_004443 [termite gut metagenome]|uniref:Uncharacterized protein n=1 Tax=termite gut metagenome TaxID=433724 RepID=A0A5J4SPM1_9ZZZZ
MNNHPVSNEVLVCRCIKKGAIRKNAPINTKIIPEFFKKDFMPLKISTN